MEEGAASGEVCIVIKKIPFSCTVILLTVCLFNIICTQSVYAQAETDIYSNIDIYLKSCAENARIPSMSVTVVDKDNVLFAQSYGGCESCDTSFLLGSVSKSFTAVCIMQLTEQGKIDLKGN